MPPSSQQREDIKMENINNEKLVQAVVEFHMTRFVHEMTDALKRFVAPLNPADGEEEMNYIRSVMEAVDNVVLTALMMKGDAGAEEKTKASTEEMLKQLIEMHNGGEVKH